jgi:hypothetical protein
MGEVGSPRWLEEVGIKGATRARWRRRRSLCVHVASEGSSGSASCSKRKGERAGVARGAEREVGGHEWKKRKDEGFFAKGLGASAGGRKAKRASHRLGLGFV